MCELAYTFVKNAKNLHIKQSCGETTYFDVRETSPSGIERIRQVFNTPQLGDGDVRHHHGISSDTTPRIPPEAHTRPLGGQLDVGEPRSVMSQATGESSASQHLLVCFNPKQLTVLVQLEVGSLTNDGYLFRDIRSAYEGVLADHAWHISMFLPETVRNAIPNRPQFLSRLYQKLASIRLHSIKSGDIVKVSIHCQVPFSKSKIIYNFSLVSSLPCWRECSPHVFQLRVPPCDRGSQSEVCLSTCAYGNSSRKYSASPSIKTRLDSSGLEMAVDAA